MLIIFLFFIILISPFFFIDQRTRCSLSTLGSHTVDGWSTRGFAGSDTLTLGPFEYMQSAAH
jgi:hypothetical protein